MHRIEQNDAGSTVACVSRRSLVHGGFTLVEVLVAVVLLSVGLLAVLSAGEATRETQQRAVYMAAGRIVAQTKVEEARATAYGQLNLSAGTSSDPSLPPGNTVNIAVVQYTNALGQQDPDLKQFTVTVTWPEEQSTRSIVYETLIANKS